MAKEFAISYRYASNIAILVNLKEYKLYEMKSYDCNVFMHTSILISYRDLLPNGYRIHL